MKKYLTVILAAFALLISGCTGGKPLTKQEYFDEVTKLVYTRNAAVIEICFSLYEYEENDTPLNKDEVRAQAQTAEEAVLQIKSLTPPSEYSGYHTEMCDGVSSELQWFDALDTALAADSKSEFSQAADRMHEISEKSTLISAWSNFVISVSGEVEIDYEKLGLG